MADSEVVVDHVKVAHRQAMAELKRLHPRRVRLIKFVCSENGLSSAETALFLEETLIRENRALYRALYEFYFKSSKRHMETVFSSVKGGS